VRTTSAPAAITLHPGDLHGIAEILDYADARPRTIATLSEPSFIATKKKSMEIFQREVRR
jgi:hypothetical protein